MKVLFSQHIIILCEFNLAAPSLISLFFRAWPVLLQHVLGGIRITRKTLKLEHWEKTIKMNTSDNTDTGILAKTRTQARNEFILPNRFLTASQQSTTPLQRVSRQRDSHALFHGFLGKLHLKKKKKKNLKSLKIDKMRKIFFFALSIY